MVQRCPYCLERPADTDDHIYSRFLGGRRSVPSCQHCNNDLFGSAFEAQVANEFSPLLIGLSYCGIEPTKDPKWKSAFTRDGVEYTLDKRMAATVTKPIIHRDPEGNFIGGIFPHNMKISKFSEKFKLEVKEFPLDLNTTPSTFKLLIGNGLRRLSIKMCIALMNLYQIDRSSLDSDMRQYLLNENSPVGLVHMDLRKHDALDSLVSALSHVIYIQGQKSSGRVYAIVQFFSIVQIYVPLGSKYDGEDFSILSVLDITTRAEKFEHTSPLNIHTPPRNISAQEYSAGLTRWMARWNKLLAQNSTGKLWTLTAENSIDVNLPQPDESTGQAMLGDQELYSLIYPTIAKKLGGIPCPVHQKYTVISDNYQKLEGAIEINLQYCCSTLQAKVQEALANTKAAP